MSNVSGTNQSPSSHISLLFYWSRF